MRADLEKLPFHYVTSNGEVKVKKTNKAIKEEFTVRSGRGKVRLNLGKDEKGKKINPRFFTDELVAEAFLPKPQKLTEDEVVILHHKDGNLKISNVTNLEWIFPFREPEITREIPLSSLLPERNFKINHKENKDKEEENENEYNESEDCEKTEENGDEMLEDPK